MKRILALLLCLSLLICFAGCTAAGKVKQLVRPTEAEEEEEAEELPEAGEDTEVDEDLPTFESVADVLAIVPDANLHRMITSTYFVCAFSYREGVTLRVVADIPAEIDEKIQALDFFDDYREIQERELIAPLAVRSVERLDDQIPTREELDQYIGKTTLELLFLGFERNGYSIGDESVFLSMTKGISEFEVELDGIIEESVYSADDFDDERLLEIAYAFPVKNITVSGLSGACLNID